jgi:hypothetical protein
MEDTIINQDETPTVHTLSSHDTIHTQMVSNGTLPEGKYCSSIGSHLSIGDFVRFSGMPAWTPANCVSPRALGMAYRIESSLGQVIEFGSTRSGGNVAEVVVKVCLWVFHDDLPSASRPESLVPMTDDITVYPTELIVECKLNCCESVGLCVHADNYSYRNMRGMMNTFRVHSSLTVGLSNTFTPVSVLQHVQSSQALFTSYKHYPSAGERFFVELTEIRDKTRRVLSRVGAKQKQYGKEKVVISPGTWLMLKKKLEDMPGESTDPLGSRIHEHKMHFSKSAIDTKAKAVHYSRDGQLSMQSHLEVSEKDDGADHRERVKVYTIHQLTYCRRHVLGQMFGVGARHQYPKLIKETDKNGGRKITSSFASSKVLVNTKVNVVTHLPTSTIFGVEPLFNCGQHIDGILFLYEETTRVLTIKVRYLSVSLQKAKRKGWLPCSEVYNNSPHAIDVGEMFPAAGVMYQVDQILPGTNVLVRRMCDGTLITMSAMMVNASLNMNSS